MTNDKTEKIIITGPSGSGKDYLRKKLIGFGLKYSPKFTTRPKREHELEGEDYNFIDDNTYNNYLIDNKIKTTQKFSINGVDWQYGITKENWENNQLFILTPFEIGQISNDELKGCFVVYLKIDEDIRYTRINERKDSNDSVDRRIKSDNEDFKDFSRYDLCITDHEFEAEWIYDLMN